MKYFQAIVFAFFAFGVIVWFYRFWKRMQADQLFKVISRAVFKMQESQPGRSYFSTRMIRRALRLVGKEPRSVQEKLIENLKAEKMPEFISFLKQKKAGAAAAEFATAADFNQDTEAQKIAVQKYGGSANLLLLAAQYFNGGERPQFKAVMDRLDNMKLRGYHRAKAAYWRGWQNLAEGDLEGAADSCSQAAAGFNQEQAYYEEAETYILAAMVYRICGVEDTAEFMLRSAVKILQSLKALKLEAEAWGNFGMLMSLQSRFEEAEEYFGKAATLYVACNNPQGEAEIINQQALTAILKKEFPKAKELATTALKQHNALKNPAGEALSQEIIAYGAAAEGDWKLVQKAARRAQKLYLDVRNLASLLEAMLLEARALTNTHQVDKAETILRKIIANAAEEHSCFHVANAYNQLGLICLKRGELRRAKGLFQQSASCEQRSNRQAGLAVDYANIALVEHQRGHLEEAQKNLQQAFDYAKKAGDKELEALIEDCFSNTRAELLPAGKGNAPHPD